MKYKLQVQTSPYVLVSADFSQQEPRMAATVSQDRKLIQSYRDGKDVYATVASFAFNKPYEACLEFHPETHEYQKEGKERRAEAKSIVLGILYGRSTKTIGEQLYGHDESLTEEERTKKAQYVYDSVLDAFPSLRSLMKNAQNQAKTMGYVETILGRRRHIPDMMLPQFEFEPMSKYVNPDVDPMNPETLKDQNKIPKRITNQLLKEFTHLKYFGQIVNRTKQLKEQKIKVINNRPKITDASRQVINSIVQGSAADLTKMAILNLCNNKEWQKMGGRLLTPIHDELLCEIPMENWEHGSEVLTNCMVEAASFMPFQMKCDAEVNLRWYGNEFPCKYPKPESYPTTDPEEIKWIQWHLLEMEYLLPVIKDENGDTPRGDGARGINGIITDEYTQNVFDYISTHHTTMEDFLDHIERKVVYGLE